MSGSHIAILLPDLRGGGVERLKINLSIEFLKRGYAVDFVLMQARGELMGLVPNGARVVDLKTLRVRHVLWPLVRYLRRERPDALLAAMWPLTALPPLAVFLARTCTKVLASEHVDFRMTGSWSAAVAWLAKRMGRVAYGRTDAVVAVSAGVAESISVITGFHRDRIHVIHNAIRAPVVTLGQATDNPDALFFGSPRILTVGMLKPAKNQALLLRAFSALSSYPNAGLTIVGAGPNERKLKDLADSLGIATRVNFAGFTPISPLSIEAPIYLFCHRITRVLAMSSLKRFPTVCRSYRPTAALAPRKSLRTGAGGGLSRWEMPAFLLAQSKKHWLTITTGKDLCGGRRISLQRKRRTDTYL